MYKNKGIGGIKGKWFYDVVVYGLNLFNVEMFKVVCELILLLLLKYLIEDLQFEFKENVVCFVFEFYCCDFLVKIINGIVNGILWYS